MRRRLAPLTLFLGSSLVFAACGGAMPPMEAPGKAGGYAPAPEPEPQTIEEATAQLERAKAAFDKRTAPVAMPTAPTGTMQVEPRPPTHIEATGAAADECTNLCRAFSSMQRAQAAICRLAGEGDPRCADAKRVVEDNAKRVAQCRCQ